jgi:hypothetical protein
MEKKERENLKRLAALSLLPDFVRKHNAEWDHYAWLQFQQKLEEEGYTPINIEDVGQLLEEKRAEFLNGRNDT